MCYTCVTRMGIWKMYSKSGGSAKRFSIETGPGGACLRRAHDGRMGTSRSAVPLDLHNLSLIHFLGVVGG